MQKEIELRREVDQLPTRGRAKQYPAKLRKKLTAYIRSQRLAGVSVFQLGEQLGMSWRTVSRWTEDMSKRRGFKRVTVAEPEPTSGGLTVQGRCGVRVEGLQLEQVAELLRRLG